MTAGGRSGSLPSAAPLRAAIVGTGFVGTQHVEALRRLPGVEVAVVCGSSAERAAGHARALGVPRSSGDWQAVVGDSAIDVVHVCVPNDLHVAIAGAALAAGRHVVAEKPLALDTAEGRRLVRLAAASDRLAVLCHNYRFYPMAAELRERVRGGDLGTIHAVRGAYIQDWLLAATDTNWRIDPARSGASRTVADIGTHWIDLAETVTGRRLEAVVAQLATVHPRRPPYDGVTTFSGGEGDPAAGGEGGPRGGTGETDGWGDVETEDQAQLLLRFEGGLQGTVAVSQVGAGHKNAMELSVDGTAGSATWRQERPDELWIGRRDRPNETVLRGGASVSAAAAALARLPAGHNEGWADGLRNLLAAAYAAIRGEPVPVPLPTFEDGLRHLAFVEAAVRSAREERWVRIAEVHSMEEVAG